MLFASEHLSGVPGSGPNYSCQQALASHRLWLLIREVMVLGSKNWGSEVLSEALSLSFEGSGSYDTKWTPSRTCSGATLWESWDPCVWVYPAPSPVLCPT